MPALFTSTSIRPKRETAYPNLCGRARVADVSVDECTFAAAGNAFVFGNVSRVCDYAVPRFRNASTSRADPL